MKSFFGQTIFAALLFIGLVSFANAATFTVTKTADTNDGVCDADCSLREAIAQVNADTTTMTIHRIEFSSLFNTPQTIAIVSSRLHIGADTRVEINGSGNHNITLTTAIGTQAGVLRIESTYGRIDNIRFADAVNTFYSGGGGISIGDFVQVVEIENCLFENNTAERGAAIDSFFAALTIKNSTFRNNRSTEYDGGAFSAYSNEPTVVSGSTFENNTTQNGGAVSIHTASGASVSKVFNSTFTGNNSLDTFDPASTIYNAGGTLDLINITVVYNSTTGVSPNNAAIGGSVFLGAVTNLSNSIVMGNQVGTIFNTLQTGPNEIGSGAPAIDALTWNGGPTQTHALQAISTAIDAGTSVGASLVDQRGVSRPQGGGVDLGAFESGTPISDTTPTGLNVPVTIGAVSVNFSGVSTGGTTSQTAILPTSAGIVPGGYSLGAGYPAFEISTTAIITPPIVVCIQVSSTTTLAAFNALRIMHNEGGILVDRTILTPDLPAPNFTTKTICGRVTSLSPFVIAEALAPSSANVSVSGRVVSGDGIGIARTVVSLTDQTGATRFAVSNQFGYFRIDDLEIGTYVANATSKAFGFAPQVINLSESIQNLNFTPTTTPEIRSLK